MTKIYDSEKTTPLTLEEIERMKDFTKLINCDNGIKSILIRILAHLAADIKNK